MWRHGLSWQILLSMAVVTVIAALIVFAGSYIGFALVIFIFPEALDYEGWVPSGSELLIFVTSIFLALIVAGWVAMRLAARILAPLSSLAESARRIASGDLSARAVGGDLSLGEIAHLIDDFNTMAEKLEDMADGVVSWNAAIAHELRTPLTILRGRLHGIADGVFTMDDHIVRNLLVQIDGLSRLVEDLQIVTLADSGHLSLQKEPINLRAEVKRVLDFVGLSLEEAGFSVEPILSDIIVSADGIRIRQALLALLENARHYATPGLIEISTLTISGMVIIRVEDVGPGLSPDFAKKAFEPFARSDPSRSRRYGGSGLGLSVVRAIAEAHGGGASYRSSARGGATFEISLPIN